MSKYQSKNRVVVGDAQWANDLPKELLEELKEERYIYGLLSIISPEVEKVGDVEVLIYLMTASQRAPLRHNFTEIYVYLASRYAKKKGKHLEPFMVNKLKDGLTDDQKRELRELRSMIYDKRGGEIDIPLFNVLRKFQKDCQKASQNPQQPLF